MLKLYRIRAGTSARETHRRIVQRSERLLKVSRRVLMAIRTPMISITADPLTVRVEPSCGSRGAVAKTWVLLVRYIVCNLRIAGRKARVNATDATPSCRQKLLPFPILSARKQMRRAGRITANKS